jgi:hypothetical protein
MEDQKMESLAANTFKPSGRPSGDLHDDPRYMEIKKIIEDFPPEKLKLLKRYIDSWVANLPGE